MRNVSVWLQDSHKTSGLHFVPAHWQTLRKFHIPKNAFLIAPRASITFPNIRHLQNIGFAQSASNGAVHWYICLLGDT